MNLISCPKCHGTGNVRCAACSSTGKDSRGDMCPICYGSRTVICVPCGGSGTITKK